MSLLQKRPPQGRNLEEPISITASILCCNYGRFLKQAIESCLNQYPGDYRLEVLVLDDGSTDETPEICASFGDLIRVSRTENQGFGATLARCVHEAKGEYVCMLDADDWWEPNKINSILPALRNGALYVIHPLWHVDGRGRRLGGWGACGNTSSVCVHREAGLTLLPGTSEIFCRPLMDFGRGVEIDKPLGSYRIHDAAMTDRSATSAHTAFFARTAHIAADRLEALAESPPEWATAKQLKRIARKYRAEGFTKDFQRLTELHRVSAYPAGYVRMMGWWLFSKRFPDERHFRLTARALLNVVGIRREPRFSFQATPRGDDPRVIQTCGGRFHHFELAKQLDRHGLLKAFYTGYPRFATREGDYPKDVTHIPLSWELAQLAMRGFARLGFVRTTTAWGVAEYISNIQDGFMERQVPEADIIVALSGSSLKTARRARELGVKFVCDRGSVHIRTQSELLQEEYARWGERFSGVDPRRIAKEEEEYEIADAITVPSEFARASYLARGISGEKVHVINYGVNLDDFRGESLANQSDFNVLFVGNVSFRKGIPYLLEAFSSFRHPRKRLRIVGAILSDFSPWLSRQKLEGIEFISRIDRRELREIMLRSHALVLPSIEDGFGLVAAEAMACGCPPIVSANVGAAEIIVHQRSGVIIPIRDAGAIQEAFSTLAGDAAFRHSLSACGRECVASLGGWDQYGNQYAGLLRKIWNGQ